MILNSSNNGFVILFPNSFFSEDIKEKYKKYYQSLILPYDTIEEFMSSTIQSIDFPGWSMDLASQTRVLGKKQEYKSSVPVEDLFIRDFKITFKMTDAFLNYWIFLENAQHFVDFKNTAQTLEPIQMSLLNNEGYVVATVIFDKPILKGQDGIKLSYSSVNPNFNTFTASFKYIKFDVRLEID